MNIVTQNPKVSQSPRYPPRRLVLRWLVRCLGAYSPAVREYYRIKLDTLGRRHPRQASRSHDG